MLSPDRGPPPKWGIGAGWAPWGATDWRYFRAWLLVRICGAIPLVVWDAGDLPTVTPSCPCCDAKDVGMAHLVESCPGTEEARLDMTSVTLSEVLAGDPDVGVLRRRVRGVGRAMALAVVGLAARRRAATRGEPGAAD